MTRYVFDPSRLRGTAKQQEQAGYAVAGRMLRDHIGGDDIFAEVRRRVRSDPRFGELVDELRTASERADEALREELARRMDPVGRRDVDGAYALKGGEPLLRAVDMLTADS